MNTEQMEPVKSTHEFHLVPLKMLSVCKQKH